LRLGLLSGIPRLHSHTPYSVGSLWPRNRPVPDISTWQYTTIPRLTSIPRRGFERTNPASQLSRTLTLDHVVPGLEPSHWINILHNCGIRKKNLVERTLYYPWADYPFAYANG